MPAIYSWPTGETPRDFFEKIVDGELKADKKRTPKACAAAGVERITHLHGALNFLRGFVDYLEETTEPEGYDVPDYENYGNDATRMPLITVTVPRINTAESLVLGECQQDNDKQTWQEASRVLISIDAADTALRQPWHSEPL